MWTICCMHELYIGYCVEQCIAQLIITINSGKFGKQSIWQSLWQSIWPNYRQWILLNAVNAFRNGDISHVVCSGHSSYLSRLETVSVCTCMDGSYSPLIEHRIWASWSRCTYRRWGTISLKGHSRSFEIYFNVNCKCSLRQHRTT